MSRSVSCALCGREVDNQDTVEMPNGPVCMHPCYEWLERMIEEANECDPDDDGFEVEIIIVDPWEDDGDDI